MNRSMLLSAALALMLVPTAGQAQTASSVPPSVAGTWINPKGTVKVETGPCAGKLCGWVVWASPQAQADARESGITNLIGTELLRDYRGVGANRYQGTVYVPDMGRTFFSKIQQQGPNSLKISGCVLGGWICKSQDWHRA